MANLQIGFMLMLVGMVTVFIILLIVIYGSQLLISLVNKIFPEAATSPKKSETTDIDTVTKQVLEAAVAQLTSGKGHITGISKM